MRPSVLDPLFAPLSVLPGIGPRTGALYAKLLGRESVDDCRVIDLVFHLPHGLVDRRFQPTIANAPEGVIVTIRGYVDRHQPAPRGKSNVPYRVFIVDDTGELSLTYFRGKQEWLSKLLPVGEEVIISGKVEWFNGRPSMVHPDFAISAEKASELPLVEPVYPMTAGLSTKALRKAVQSALERIPALDEWDDPAFAKQQNFPTFRDAVQRLHHPDDESDVDLQAPARRRLAYDEFLASQISLALVRKRMRKAAGIPVHGTGVLSKIIRQSLPFSLTNSQEAAVVDILQDMAAEDRMLRLLQGDVGSGKTAVALMAMTAVVEDGGQAVLMAPTEILARQHLETLTKFAKVADINVEILTGRHKGKEREAILERIASGETQIIVGTHALFQDTVVYHNLRLAVVDEQHRFGVHQRLSLTAKGVAPHMLVMTATPIPRTLVLAAFGDMDVSRLTEKPAGRKPITTAAIPLERIEEILERLRIAIAEGKKAYWICPLVEESDVSELMPAEVRFERLGKVFGNQVGLVHGKMVGTDKDAAMAAFKRGETRLLVATTVIEVGVDVPDASIIVIEHAERFGLAQLHQLRGRVGRGDEASTCLLLYKSPLSENGRARLNIMRETEDGFLIAEEDLRLRGEGELLGTRQSGTPGFNLANLEAHADLLEIARKDANLIISTDEALTGERGQRIRTLLYLHRRDEAVRFIRAG